MIAAMTGSDLRAWRKAKGWSQARLAQEIGRGLRMVQHYEAGTSPIPRPVALLLRFLAKRR